MILNEAEIRHMNYEMLGLGAPVDRDDIGYNKPDWSRMEPYGRYLGQMVPAQLYTVLRTLSHYQNTQLSNRAEDIAESIAYYKKLQKDQDEPLLPVNVDNYMSKEIVLVGIKELQLKKVYAQAPMIILKIMGSNSEQWTIRNTIIDKIRESDANSEVNVAMKDDFVWVAVPPIDYEWVTDLLKQTGKYGYELSQSAAKTISVSLTKLIEMYQQAVNNAAKKPVEILNVSETKVLIHFDGFIGEINNLKSTYNIRSINANGIWNTEVPINILDIINPIFEKHGYETLNKDIVYAAANEAKEAAIKAAEAEAERLRTWNVSSNQLVDLSTYTLPFKPYPYQLEDANIIVAHKRLLLGHDMGCGKTFIAGIVGESIPVPKLVIVPESLRLNWKRELLQINPNQDVKVLASKDKFVTGKDWTIIGYSSATKFLQDLLNSNIQCVFIDEAHRCKSIDNFGKPNSKRAKSVLQICENVEYCYPMTGTPIPTSNKDLYNIFKMLQVPEVITGDQWDFMNFGKTYCDGFNNGYGWDFTGSSNNAELHGLLSKYMVRRRKKDVLPNLTKQRIFIPIQITGREYAGIEKRLNEASDYDTFMGLAMTGRRVMSKQKLEASLDIAEDILNNGGSVVIVSCFNETLDEIQRVFGSDCCCIRGGMSDEAKQKAVDDFQSGAVHVCALNVIAGGVGITLTKAHDMIICDYDWTPSNMSQVEDRICRSGQKEHCLIHYIYGENSTFDQLFMDMITGKSKNIDAVVDNDENTMDFVEGKSSESSQSFIKQLMKLKKKK